MHENNIKHKTNKHDNKQMISFLMVSRIIAIYCVIYETVYETVVLINHYYYYCYY